MQDTEVLIFVFSIQFLIHLTKNYWEMQQHSLGGALSASIQQHKNYF